jgi:hypothetical protein
LVEGKEFLDKLKKEEEDCGRKCEQLFVDAKKCQKEKEETQVKLEQNKARLIRANKLLTGLKDEKTRQNEEVKRLLNETK